MVTVVIVIVARDTQVTRYTGHMTAQSISTSLPYYNAPVIRQLDANTVKEFIATCKEDGLSGVLGIFPKTTTTGKCDHVVYKCIGNILGKAIHQILANNISLLQSVFPTKWFRSPP